MKKILIVVTNEALVGARGRKTGLWLRELTDFYHEIKEHFDVDIISTASSRVPIDPLSLMEAVVHKQTRHYYMNDELMGKLKKPMTPDQVKDRDYAAIYFTGGHGTMIDFPNHPGLQQLTASIYERGGVVAAVCHGPSALQNIHLSDGRNLLAGHVVTGFSDLEEKIMGMYGDIPFSLEQALRNQGTLFQIAQLPFTACVIESGRLVTGQNPASASLVGKKVKELLKEVNPA
ncbi:type 1 glutamine amidotransferase domain-containing protein [Planococcus sp. CPCC 101016]|uniref:type 1 glutamine amidotransferase domain-containing protein n=1 Tax=Planococcus sp. CPCC 101016 TaxID=2599617 RepID=UPI0011B7F8A6|nr:type 1 glutamine amidotransferase domain-containing protein [Planococcus sp. CPCC 101016]TWT04277.1 type 1 glutamine amidotransferase domain-containing protein [Planococcus sp. CPCC 101016]